MKKKEYSMEVGGKKLTAIFSDLAEQANGSVMIKYGNIVRDVVIKGEGFFPLAFWF